MHFYCEDHLPKFHPFNRLTSDIFFWDQNPGSYYCMYSSIFRHINQFIYMCGNIPLQCSVMLWEVFNMMVNLNIVPANDAMLILLRLLLTYII